MEIDLELTEKSAKNTMSSSSSSNFIDIKKV